ncbi:MAG: anthranilate phosphoribosyltransferase [Solirubrobacteraceae bacterium]
MSVQAGSRRTTYAGFSATLKLVGTGPRGSRDLTFEEARNAVRALMAGAATPAQAGAFLIATRVKGESGAELAGYVEGLREAVDRTVSVPEPGRPVVACAGAYDGCAEAPHLSLAAGVVAAACGAGIVIHCGPPVGPKYGVTPLDVLGELGGRAAVSLAQSAAMLARSGVSVVDTSRAVRGWEPLLAIRNEVGLRGPLHSAEKLIDYFGARRFVVGYTHSPYADRLLEAFRILGAERAIVVRGLEGSDIVRPGRPVARDLAGALELPERLGENITAGGGAAESAALTEAILTGEHSGAERTAVLLSAAVRLFAAGIVRDPRDGLDLADAAVRHGGARRTLAAMLAL